MGFPKAVHPMIQNGLKLVVFEVDLDTLGASASQLEEVISPKTKAIMVAHTANGYATRETSVDFVG
jgi:dTDP-4-amino-4,6-dideoxygalactose transaminase